MSLQVSAGTLLQCAFGVAPAPLIVLPLNRVLTGAPAANIMDHVPMVNIPPFGMCSSPANPMVAAATAAALGVLVPMLTLLGKSEMPASLEGYGPIDAETARRLAGDATSIYRILTDPVTGAILDIDQPTKHIPDGLRRMRQLIDQTCTFPGCGKRAANCDLDHTIDRQFGGRTTLMNLSHLCRNHHRDKHNTKWMITQDATGRIEWRSPTGFVAVPDPPPF